MGLKILKEQNRIWELRMEEQRGIKQGEGQDWERMIGHKNIGMDPQVHGLKKNVIK